jgi:hypothetical protein
MKRRVSLPVDRTFDDRSAARGEFGRVVLAMRLVGCLAILGAALSVTLNACAQNGKPSEAAKTQETAAPLSHDLSGVWMQYPQGDLPGTPGMNTVNERFRPPLTPWGQARLDAARPLVGPKAVAGEENSPTLRCDPDGPPKVLNHPNPFEIVQIPGRMFMFFEEQHIWRTIWADGRELPKEPDPSYLGYAVGKWEGDTFIVETTGFNDKVWADAYGDPRSEQTHLTERYRRLNHDTLELQVTIDDPKSYTKVWVSPPKLHKLEPKWEIAEWFCASSELQTYDKDVRKPSGGAATPPSK